MPTYKVIYFNIPGRAELIRLLFSYGQIPFVDERVSKDDWPKLKPTTPYGQLPVLEVDGVSIPQSNAIYRYVANLVGLTGKDAKENLAIDIAVEAIADLQKGAMDIRMGHDESKKEENKKKFQEKLACTMKKLNEDAGKNGGYLALNKLTWVDVLFIQNYEGWVNILDQDIVSSYPNLRKVIKNVLSLKGIQDWIKKRPENPMKPKYDLKQDI